MVYANAKWVPITVGLQLAKYSSFSTFSITLLPQWRSDIEMMSKGMRVKSAPGADVSRDMVAFRVEMLETV